jgi:hypothetical protein
MRRDFVVTALCLLALALSVQAHAEVRVLTDRHGAYKMTRVVLDGRTGRVWSPLRRGNTATVLNIGGDRNGDLYPTVGETPLEPYYPWVVWSRYNQDQYDLAWSRWDNSGWEPIRWVDPAAEPELGDSLDVDLTFDDVGRPYVVWWRDEGSGGRVYLSVFLATSWMRSFAVSEIGVDSRYPLLAVPEPGLMVVRYSTPAGTVEQMIVFTEPDMITDDINPLDYIHTESISVISD